MKKTKNFYFGQNVCKRSRPVDRPARQGAGNIRFLFLPCILEPQITCTRKRITAGTGFCKDADGTGTFHKRVLNGKYTSAYFYHRQYPD